MASGRFEHPILVRDEDIDANGHANNVTYLRWVQESAIAHWEAVVPADEAEGISWVVIRHEIDYKSPAFRAEHLLGLTWVGTITAATTERFCEIRRASDGAVLASARTVWCAIDAATGRPMRVNPRIRSRFSGGGDPPISDRGAAP